MPAQVPSERGFRPYTRPKDGPQRPLMGHTLGSWWFNISHFPGSIFRRIWRAIVRPLVGGPTALRSWWSTALVWLVVIAAMGGIASLLLLGAHGGVEAQGVNHRAVGLPLKELRLESLNQPGTLVNANKTSGKVTLLYFWSPDVKESVECLRKIAGIERRFRGQSDFVALSVACPADKTTEQPEAQDYRREVLDLLSNQGVDLPAYIDEDRRTRKSAELAGAFRDRYPTLLVLGGNGKIEGVWTHFDINSGEYAQSLVGKLLSF